MKCLIIEDDKFSQQILADMIGDMGKDLEVVGYAATIAEAVDAVHKLKPELIFLDIELPDGQGFQLFEKIEKVDFQTIFITSNNQHAIRAFKYSAVDYLLKPVNPEQLKDAVGRALKQKDDFAGALKMKLLADHFGPRSEEPNKIALPIAEGFCFVKMSDIIYCAADGNYTTLIMKNKEKIVISRGIRDFEELLPEDNFFRIHKSFLINLRFISKYIKSDGGYIIMDNGDNLPLAVRKKELFMEKLKKV